MKRVAALILLLQCASPAFGQSHFRDNAGAKGIARGPAESAITAEIEKRNVPCYHLEKGEVKCRIVDRALNADVHYGTIGGSGRRAALVSVRWQYDITGNAVDARALVFVEDDEGAFTLAHAGPMMGLTVSEVSFEPGRVRYRTQTLRPGDSRAAPTGTARMTIAYGPKASPAHVNRQAIAAMKPMELVKSAQTFARNVLLVKNDMKFAENLAPFLTPSFRATLSNAWAPGQTCPVYDGDPRIGGAQGLGNIHAIKTDINPKNIVPPHIPVDVTFKDREMPGTVFRSQIKIELNDAGWQVDDFIVRGKSVRAAMKAGIAECGSDAAKAAEAARRVK